MVPEEKTLKNRLHLDIPAGGDRATPIDERRTRVDAKVAELVALGARPDVSHDTEGLDHYGVTLQDPEGNEFCIH